MAGILRFDAERLPSNFSDNVVQAVVERDGSILKNLLEENRDEFDFEMRTSEGYTVLMYCAQKGFDDIAELLIVNGAQINQTDNWGNTSLMMACDAGHQSAVKVLLSLGAHMNKKNNEGETALMKACIKNHCCIVSELLASGIDISSENLRNITREHPNLHMMISNHIITIKSKLKECAKRALPKLHFIKDVFPLHCLSLDESTTYTIRFKHKLNDQLAPELNINGMLLFIAEAWFIENDVKCRLHGEGVVTSVKLNSNEQKPISEGNFYIFNFNPVEGHNVLELETNATLNPEIKLIVSAYEVQTN